MKSDWKSYSNILLAGIFWGSIGIFVKVLTGLGSTSVYTAFLRVSMAAPVMVIVTLCIDGKKAFVVSKKVLLSCMALAAVCQVLFNMCYSMTIQKVGVSTGAVLLYTSPVFTGLASLLVFRERFSAKKWIALLINIIGCALTATGGNISGIEYEPIGILFGVLSGFCYGMTPIIGKFATEGTSSYAVATYNFIFGGLFFALFVRPWRGMANPLDLKILGVGFLFGLIPTALSYIFYFKGVKTIKESSKVPIIASVEIVVAACIGAALFQEHIGAANGIGILMVLFSIMLFT